MVRSSVRALTISTALLVQGAHALFEQGCNDVTEISQGFDATFYTYPLDDYEGFLPDYFTQTYNQIGSVTGTAQGITNINFKGRVPWSIFPESSDGTIYGQDVSVSNFGVELTGYYKAPLTGFYTFILDAQDGLSLQLGTGSNGCCGDFDSEIVNPNYVSAIGSILESFNTWVAYLEEGTYYPIRLFYFNAKGNYKLKLSVLLPNLKTKTTFDDVYQIDNSGLCSPATSSTNAVAPTSVQSTSTAPEATSTAPEATSTAPEATSTAPAVTSSAASTQSFPTTLVLPTSSAPVTTSKAAQTSSTSSSVHSTTPSSIHSSTPSSVHSTSYVTPYSSAPVPISSARYYSNGTTY